MSATRNLPLLLSIALSLSCATTAPDVQSGAAIDHIMVGVRDLDEGVTAFRAATGVMPVYGGRHPRYGTHNALISLGTGTYLELIAPTHELSDNELVAKLHKLDRMTPLTWGIRVKDAARTRERLVKAGFAVTPVEVGSRATPAGTTIHWTTFDFDAIEGAPFFVEWAADTPHPSTTSPGGCKLQSFNVANPAAKELTRALAIAGVATQIDPSDRAKITLSLDCGGRIVRFGD